MSIAFSIDSGPSGDTQTIAAGDMASGITPTATGLHNHQEVVNMQDVTKSNTANCDEAKHDRMQNCGDRASIICLIKTNQTKIRKVVVLAQNVQGAVDRIGVPYPMRQSPLGSVDAATPA